MREACEAIWQRKFGCSFESMLALGYDTQPLAIQDVPPEDQATANDQFCVKLYDLLKEVGPIGAVEWAVTVLVQGTPDRSVGKVRETEVCNFCTLPLFLGPSDTEYEFVICPMCNEFGHRHCCRQGFDPILCEANHLLSHMPAAISVGMYSRQRLRMGIEIVTNFTEDVGRVAGGSEVAQEHLTLIMENHRKSQARHMSAAKCKLFSNQEQKDRRSHLRGDSSDEEDLAFETNCSACGGAMCWKTQAECRFQSRHACAKMLRFWLADHTEKGGLMFKRCEDRPGE